MTRRKKFILNTGTSLLKQLVATICGFVLPRYMLEYFGSSVNGLVSSITYFLGFISFLEMGIGAVIQSNLYGPLAKKDDVQMSKIVVASEKFFKRIAFIFLGYIVVLFFVFPQYINSDYEFWFSGSLVLIISISTFAQYYFGITYQLLLNADQKIYVQTILQIITLILNTVICIILMKFGASIHAVKLFSALIFVLRPIGQIIYVHKHYLIDKTVTYDEEPIKQKWNGFSQHVAAVICSNADVVILTLFSSLKNVSIYSVYYAVTNGVTQIVLTAASGLESLFGNMIANSERTALQNTFSAVELLIHTIVTILYTVTAISIVPFISVYTKGINDANYIVPLFGVLLVLAYGAQCLRIPYFRIIKAAGHFRETQNGAFVSAILNVVISIVLVFKFGLSGIAVGTLIAMMYHTLYFVWYLKSNIIFRSPIVFLKFIVTDSIEGVLSFFVCKLFVMEDLSYLSWMVYVLKVGIITIVIVVLINYLLYSKKVKRLFQLLCFN